MDKEIVGDDMEKQVVVQRENEEPKKHGGWQTMPYIMGNETCEKLASLGLVNSLVIYLRAQYNLDNVSAATINTVWSGSCNFAPLLGAYVADTYLGKFWTLVFGTLSSSLGMWLLTLTAALPALRPPKCEGEVYCTEPESWQLGVLYIGLGLLVIGAGGIRPCNIGFAVDQFDITSSKGKKQIESFYNWYYLTFTISILIALTGLVYIQIKVNWAYGLAIPAAFMILSCIIFVLGKKLYILVKPGGSIFGDFARVIVASFRKRNIKGVEYLYDPVVSDQNVTTKLAKTDEFKCLDKAAMITEQDMFNSQGAPINGWRLCSVEQVEKLKCLLNIFPVWASGIACFVIKEQQSTFGVLQAMQLNVKLTKKFEIPPQSIQLVPMITLSMYILIYQHLILPMARKFTRSGITLKQRMVGGILMSILSMVTSGLVEMRRRDVALKHGLFVAPMSITWLFPQFGITGLIEVLTGIGLMEFFNSRLPQSMRTLANAFFFLNLAIASYLNSFIVNMVNESELNWLGGHDLNMNRLDKYYFFLSGLGVVNLVYFTTFASRYVVRTKDTA